MRKLLTHIILDIVLDSTYDWYAVRIHVADAAAIVVCPDAAINAVVAISHGAAYVMLRRWQRAAKRGELLPPSSLGTLRGVDGKLPARVIVQRLPASHEEWREFILRHYAQLRARGLQCRIDWPMRRRPTLGAADAPNGAPLT